MSKLKQARKFAKKATALATVFGMAASLIPAVPMQAKAADFTGQLTEVKSVEVDRTNKNIVMVTFNNNVKGKITFLEDGIFRYNVDPSGQFSKYAAPNDTNHKGRIPQYPDESSKYSHPEAAVTSSEDAFTVKSGDVSIIFDKATAKMTIKENNQTVMEEEAYYTFCRRYSPDDKETKWREFLRRRYAERPVCTYRRGYFNREPGLDRWGGSISEPILLFHQRLWGFA